MTIVHLVHRVAALGASTRARLGVGLVALALAGAPLLLAALPGLSSFAAPLSVLALGLLFGVKHAVEADHVVAVTTIVAESRSIGRAAAVGALWGAGHTAMLVVVGIAVVAFRIVIPESVSLWLELGVAATIVTLGAGVVVKAFRRRTDVHLHAHDHGDGRAHRHVHFHDPAGDTTAAAHSHVVSRVGLKPVLVGAMHGLAGSGALTLFVLAQTDSAAVGALYLAVFGAGSIAGMLAMSGAIGVPFALAGRAAGGSHRALQACAGAASVAFGLWYAVDCLTS